MIFQCSGMSLPKVAATTVLVLFKVIILVYNNEYFNSLYHDVLVYPAFMCISLPFRFHNLLGYFFCL